MYFFLAKYVGPYYISMLRLFDIKSFLLRFMFCLTQKISTDFINITCGASYRLDKPLIVLN